MLLDYINKLSYKRNIFVEVIIKCKQLFTLSKQNPISHYIYSNWNIFIKKLFIDFGIQQNMTEESNKAEIKNPGVIKYIEFHLSNPQKTQDYLELKIKFSEVFK